MGAEIGVAQFQLFDQEDRERIANSKPTIDAFCPYGIPYQYEVINLIRSDFDYSVGNLEILLSGSYGSAKSVLLAHLAVTHCLENPRARVALVRRTLPDLKRTIYQEILEHIQDCLVEKKDYRNNDSIARIRFSNGSEIIAVSWADRKYTKVRSLKLSMVIIEEAVENDAQDFDGFMAIKARLRRLPHVKENVLMCATNPGDPGHWLYDYFITPNEGGRIHPTRRVFYSLTEQNIYLDPVYIRQLKADMDPKQADRYLRGIWREISKDKVYYSYDSNINFRGYNYDIDLKEPIYISWDFNIGVGKPLSLCLFQYIKDEFHFFSEIVIEGLRTMDSLDELADRGFLDLKVPKFIVCGDAAGKHRDTRNNQDDYSIIMNFLSNYKTKDNRSIVFEKWVPVSNPAIRKRHNQVNAYCVNDLGNVRLFVYEPCKYLHKGFRLVELRKGAELVEDDSKDYQHVTTAAGYGIHAAILWHNKANTHTKEWN